MLSHEVKPSQEKAAYEILSTLPLGDLSAELPNGTILSFIKKYHGYQAAKIVTSIATVFDPATGEKILEYDLEEFILEMKVLSRSEIAATNDKHQILVFDLSKKTKITISDSNAGISSLDVTSKNEIVTLHNNNEIKMWDIELKKCIATCAIPTPLSYKFTLVKDRFVITRHSNADLCISDLKNASSTKLCEDANYYYTIMPNGNVVTSHVNGNNNHIKYWDIETNKCIQTCIAPSHISGLTALSDELVISGHWVVPSGSPKTICLWNINTGNCLETKAVNKSRFDLAKLPNTPYFIVYQYEAIYSWQSFIQLWELNDNNQMVYKNHFPSVRGYHYFYKAKIVSSGRFLSHRDGDGGDQLVEFAEIKADRERLELIKENVAAVLYPKELCELVCDYYSSSSTVSTLFNNSKKRKFQKRNELESPLSNNKMF